MLKFLNDKIIEATAKSNTDGLNKILNTDNRLIMKDGRFVLDENDKYESEIKCALNKRYNINDIKGVKKNNDSTDKNVYIIYGKEKYIAKIYNNLKHTTQMIKLYNFLNVQNISVPKIYKTNDDKQYAKIDGYYMIIYSFINGKQLEFKNKKLNSETIIKIAKYLSAFHKETENYAGRNLNKMPFEINQNLRQSVLHFDLTKDNIFINNDEVALIDLDDAKYGNSICDIAIFIANIFFSKTRGIDKKGIKVFLDSYYESDFNLKQKEIPYLKSFALMWIKYTIENNYFETSTTESFIIKEKLIKENMSKILKDII